MKTAQSIVIIFIIISGNYVFFLANTIALNYNIFCHLLGQNTSLFICFSARPYQYEIEPMGSVSEKLRRKFCIGFLCADIQ